MLKRKWHAGEMHWNVKVCQISEAQLPQNDLTSDPEQLSLPGAHMQQERNFLCDIISPVVFLLNGSVCNSRKLTTTSENSGSSVARFADQETTAENVERSFDAICER